MVVSFSVDDCIFYIKDNKSIDEVILSLIDDFLLEREEDLNGCWGIQFKRPPGTTTMTQTVQIEKSQYYGYG